MFQALSNLKWVQGESEVGVNSAEWQGRTAECVSRMGDEKIRVKVVAVLKGSQDFRNVANFKNLERGTWKHRIQCPLAAVIGRISNVASFKV